MDANKKNAVRLIVSHCAPKGESSYGDRIVDTVYDSVQEAKDAGKKHFEKGIAVLVRPTYNERDAFGVRYYREWRSFNGSDYAEIKFNCAVQD